MWLGNPLSTLIYYFAIVLLFLFKSFTILLVNLPEVLYEVALFAFLSLYT